MTEIERYAGPKATLDLAPEAWSLAQRLARTEFVPSALRGKPEAVLGAMLAGAEVGVSPMQALSKIHVIEGRPAMAAELMRAIVLREGHELWIEEQSSTRCIIAGKRRGSDRETRVTWTMDDAKRARLDRKDVWQRYPSAMLLARATAQLARTIFPDVLAGISYTIEELRDGDFLDVAEVGPDAAPEDVPAPPAEPAKRTARARRPATRGADTPAQTEPDPTPPPEREQAPLPGEDDDEPVDAVLVGPDGDELPPEGDDGYEGPDEDHGARTYTPGQILAIRTGELGLDRDGKLRLCSLIAGREIASTNELDADEVSRILEILADPDFELAAWLPGDEFEPGDSDPGAPPIDPDPAPEAEATPHRRRVKTSDTAPTVPNPATWSGDDWRGFLAARSVKVTEVLREAARLGREDESVTVPATLDAIAGSGLAELLVGFVEDLSLERRKS